MFSDGTNSALYEIIPNLQYFYVFFFETNILKNIWKTFKFILYEDNSTPTLY